jgi:hypothetical protein
MLNALAEAVRFELTKGVNPWQFSRLLPSTTRPRFRIELQTHLTVLASANVRIDHITLHLNNFVNASVDYLNRQGLNSTRTILNRLVFPVPETAHR